MLIPIRQNVSINSKFLDKNINAHLLNKLQTTMVGKCTLEYGYILGINKIIKSGYNSITPANSLVVFDLIYEAEVLKPEIDSELSGTVCMVFQHGIFVDIQGKMKVLVPTTSMPTYVYKESMFVDDNENEISMGVKLKITIVMIKYDKKEFSCIGKLKYDNSDSDSDSD